MSDDKVLSEDSTRKLKAFEQVSPYLDPNSRSNLATTSKSMLEMLRNTLHKNSVSEYGDEPTAAQGLKGYWGRVISDAETRRMLVEIYNQDVTKIPILIRKSVRTDVYIECFYNRNGHFVHKFRFDPVANRITWLHNDYSIDEDKIRYDQHHIGFGYQSISDVMDFWRDYKRNFTFIPYIKPVRIRNSMKSIDERLAKLSIPSSPKKLRHPLPDDPPGWWEDKRKRF